MHRARFVSAALVYALGIGALVFLARCGRQEQPLTSVTPSMPPPPPAESVSTEWTQYVDTVQPFLNKNCISCHSGDMPEAGVRLEPFADSAALEKNGHVLTRALRMIRQQKMPPSDQAQPAPDELKPVVLWMDHFALRVDAEDLKNPGHVTMRRLNRAEYSATMRDLLGVDFNAADGFPEDDSGFGFDNNGDILSLAPVLMEKYLGAAEVCLDQAIMVKPRDPDVQSWDAGPLEGTPPKVAAASTAPSAPAGPGRGAPPPRGRVFDYNGDIRVEQTFAKAGNYVLRVRGYGTAGTAPAAATASAPARAGFGAGGGAGAGAGAGAGRPGFGRGNAGPRPSVVFKLDGKTIDKPVTVTADFQQAAEFGIQTPVMVSAGKHTITVSFVNGASKEEYDKAVAAAATAPAATAPATAPGGGGRGGFGGGFGRGGGRGGPQTSPTGKPTLGIFAIQAVGPVDPSLDRMPDSYRKVFVALPSNSLSRTDAARQVISAFASKAYRRPVTEAELKRLMGYWSTVEKGETFERSIDLALQPVLASPYFLYRVEGEPARNDPEGVRPLNDYELATRLSYFLWSSMPDEELTRLAATGKLRQNLPAQVKRMLASPKSHALGENFGGQWLQLRKIPGDTPDAKKFPEFDEELRAAMLNETHMFFDAIIHEDRSVLDFIDADFTFVNARLAKFYGIPNVTGSDFRRVSLAGTPRGGLITQASVLTLTSYPDRTSPVLRGKWVLENLLDSAPPPPPPNIPTLEASTKDKSKLPLRQRMEAHRTDPSCISCHTVMDPIGFGLENFNAIGAWRIMDPDANNEKIDASGKFPDGQTFDGPAALRKILLGRKDEFVECLVEHMLTYALGRGLDIQDRPRVTAIAQAVAKDHYKFSTLVMQIVTNDAFQKQGTKRGDK